MLEAVDKRIGAALQQDGYAICRLLEPEQAEALRQRWCRQDDGLGDQPFRSSIMSPDINHRAQVDELVTAALMPAAGELLPQFRSCLGSWTVKLPGPSGTVQIHQDWTFVDESRWWSLGFWCALQDIGAEDGCLEVLPGSHRIRRGWRGAQQPCPLAPFEDRIASRMWAIPLKAGEAILFPPTLIHRSKPRVRGEARICASLLMLPQAAPLLYTRALDDGDGLQVWEVPDDYYIQALFGDSPRQPPVRVEPTVLDRTVMEALL